MPLQPAEIEQRLRLLTTDYRPTLNPRPFALRGSHFRLTLWINRPTPSQRSILVLLKGTFTQQGANSRLEATLARAVPPFLNLTAFVIISLYGAFVFFNEFQWYSLPIVVLPLLGLLGRNRSEIPRQRLIDTLHAYLGQHAPQPPVAPVALRVTGRDLIFGLVLLGLLDAVCALRLWRFPAGSGARTVIWGIALLSIVTWVVFFLRWLRQSTPSSPES